VQYYRTAAPDSRLIARVDDRGYDLTAARPDVESFTDLAAAASISGRSVSELTERLLEDSEPVEMASVEDDLARPLVPEEVWAAGVTYKISEEAREEESGKPEIYLDVYDADRPEVFFKATPSRTVGPDDAVGVRADSEWNVPEPELGIVLHHGDVVGYTIGNDVSSRTIEGENPLYLPQAKVYDRSCAIGPCVVAAEGVDPLDQTISMRIERDGETMYDESASTSSLVRTPEELIEYCTNHDAVPESMVLLTGTSLVPESDFTLSPGDTVEITIDGIGTLRNGVTEV
jgi:2-dehydro-3-deoxy-D-arabinonate dehydratase